jgi:glycerol-3-phosphate dehydrogenase
VNDLTFFKFQLMACIKSGRVTNSRFDQLAQEAQKDAEEEEAKRKAIPVDRSGGGV